MLCKNSFCMRIKLQKSVGTNSHSSPKGNEHSMRKNYGCLFHSQIPLIWRVYECRFPSFIATWIARPLFVNLGLSVLVLTSLTRLVKTEMRVLSCMMLKIKNLISSRKVSWGSMWSITPIIIASTSPRDACGVYTFSLLRYLRKGFPRSFISPKVFDIAMFFSHVLRHLRCGVDNTARLLLSW
jgi:hypothetical protein